MSERTQLVARARRIKLLALDVDGVLTDRRIVLSSTGSQTKHFDVQDGFGLYLARTAGLKSAIITAEKSEVVSLRARRLQIDWVAQFARDKGKVFEKCLKHFKLSAAQTAYIGDDLLDLPALSRAGFSATTADAHPEVRRRVHYVTRAPGGRGAVREVIELLLKAQGHWPAIVKRYAR